MTDPSDDDLLDTQWSVAARAAFQSAADRLVAAVESHRAALLPLSNSRGDTEKMFVANDELARAAAAYSEAQLDFTGTGWPMGAIEVDDEDEDYDDEDEPELPSGSRFISVRTRYEYLVPDVPSLLKAGGVARAKAHGESEAEPADHIGEAIYELIHAAGRPLPALDIPELLTGFGVVLVHGSAEAPEFDEDLDEIPPESLLATRDDDELLYALVER
jgi:hypothetical protein